MLRLRKQALIASACLLVAACEDPDARPAVPINGKGEAPPGKLPGLVSGCFKPVYPGAAFRKNQEGTAIVEAQVGEDGKILESHIEKSSGFPDLDAASLAVFSAGCFIDPLVLAKMPPGNLQMFKLAWKLSDFRLQK